MSIVSDYPRVLFVTPLTFNHFTGGGITFTNLFRGWPKDRLFTVHSDTLALSTDTCMNYFALSAEELPLSQPLQALRALAGRGSEATIARPSAADSSVQPGDSPASQGLAHPKGVAKSLLLRGASAFFGHSGFPVSARLSARLAAWIEAARPEVLYTILGSIEMMELVEKICVRFDLPVVVHLMDDWRAERERYGLLSPLRRRRLNELFGRSIRTAKGHLAISDAMVAAYGAEFGVRFEAIQNVIDNDQWLKNAREDVASARPARLLYAGSIYPTVQLSSLLDAAAAVARLRSRGMAITLDVMAPDFMVAPFRASLEAHDGTRVLRQVPRDRYFATLCEADVLLLPVNFETAAIRMVRYSMPTKVPEYLVSGVPVLLYAPEAIAQIDYAQRCGWGLTVTQRNPALLDAALQRIVDDRSLRQELVRRARETAAARHDAATVRTSFRTALTRACGGAESANERHCEVM